jgi:hypothetical protein
MSNEIPQPPDYRSDNASGFGIDSALYIPPYRLPMPVQLVGGGSGMDVSGGRRQVPIRRNVALMFFKAFHYGQKPMPGRLYPAYEPPLGFSRWLR